MIRLILILFLSATSLRAAVFPPAFWNPSSSHAPFVLTNEPAGSGTNMNAWWMGTDVTTNSSIWTLPDRSGVTHVGSRNFDLTNAAATSTWPTKSGSNTLMLNGTSQYMISFNYTNGQPHEIWIVAKYNGFANDGTGRRLISEVSTTAGHKQTVYITAGNFLSMYAGSTFGSIPMNETNVWRAWTFGFTNTSSFMRTNNVNREINMNIGTNPEDGLVIGAFEYPVSLWSPLEVAEIATYFVTNGVTQRSNIYYYFKTLSTVTKNLGLP